MSVSGQQEKLINRNPHGDFDAVQASRQPYQRRDFQQFQTPSPSWAPGTGANTTSPASSSPHVAIDPYAEGRPAVYNYKLLISAMVPRPIAFLSTVSKDGQRRNLAPFSYANIINHDPPLFVIGIAGSMKAAKDTLANLASQGEAVLNIVSDSYVEAMNYTSIDAPSDVSEWDLTGLTPVASDHVKPARVGEAIFAAECKLVEPAREWRNRQGQVTGVSVFLEASLFHARQDAINQDHNLIDPAVLRPVGRLGGITYATIQDGFELLRPSYEKEITSKSMQ
ncbi:hypothetical protein PYCC9005_005164 [Savitreella phatthalungensis]